MEKMTENEMRRVGKRAAVAVQAAIAPFIKTLKVDGVLEISAEAEAEIQRRAQDAVDFHWPGRFEVTCSLNNSNLDLTMKPRKVVH